MGIFINITDSTKKLEQQFRTAKLRRTPLKLINLFPSSDRCHNNQSSFEECDKINFRFDQTTFLTIHEALELNSYFRCNVEASFRWCGEEETVLSKKYNNMELRKRNALLIDDGGRQLCVIWEDCIDDVNALLDNKGKALTKVRMTNIEKVCLKEII